nr:MAG TPA: hypothetical protein [Caudoviricetes sp.]
MKKYEITDKTKVAYGVKLHQIRALVDILDDWGNVLVHKGDFGGHGKASQYCQDAIKALKMMEEED